MEDQHELTEMTVEEISSDSEDECFPRIGTDYQVDVIPPEHAGLDETEEAFGAGLPVPFTTIRVKQDPNKCASPERDEKDEPLDCDDGESSRNGCKRKGKKKRKGNWLTFRRLRARNDQMEEVVVPGEAFDSWEEIEEAGFLTGLYLFGKDFSALERFLETRRLRDLQHYYYSIFYGSAPYKRWVAARHSCSKRIVNGRDILVGWRQEELLRRILPEVEEYSRHELLEAVAEFSKGEVTVERYVSRLKAAAGLELLVDSVGVGCGKRDLTVGSVEAPNNGSKRQELPGKAFSDYTGAEMFRALSGGYRLSKTRAQDLFWEGVWPRLLAKGWSSEQSGKGPLVYMVPGIKRYSKRSHVKGKDYFDSISEVLNHLAVDPTLLELPELDNELMVKCKGDTAKKQRSSRSERESSNGVLSPSSERKRRPTLWLSKGKVVHARETDVEEERKKEPQCEGRDEDSHVVSMVHFPGQLQVHLEFTGQRDFPSAELQACEVTTAAPEGTLLTSTSLARWEGGGGEMTVPRKRSFSESFSSKASVADARIIPAGQVWNERRTSVLNSMLKKYLGNGKSFRLYAPTKRVRSQEAYKFFMKGFEQALYRNQKGIVSFNLSFVVTTVTASGNKFLTANVEAVKSSRQDCLQRQVSGGVNGRIHLSCMDCGAIEEDDGSVHKCCGKIQYL